MISSFYGLETARSALTASQVGLNVTGQNLANINTEDYTRQKVDASSANYINGSAKYALSPSSNIGQGVKISGISQIRDSFLDAEVRKANSQYNTYDTGLSALQDIENVFDETETDGLFAMLGDFYSQMEDLSNNAGSAEYEGVVRSSAEKVTQILNQYAAQLSTIRKQETTNLNISVSSVNTVVDKINSVNKLIADQALRGNVSNEMLDLRNGYLDTLSGYMDITVSANADSTVSVTASDGTDVLSSSFSVNTAAGETQIVCTASDGTESVFEPAEGSLRGYLKTLNGAGVYASEGDYKGIAYYENAINDFAKSFADTLNQINTDAGGEVLFASTVDGEDISAANIGISTDWRADPSCIKSSGPEGKANVMRMINAMDSDRAVSPYFTGTFEEFTNALMSDIAVDVGYQADMKTMYGGILTAASDQRESVVGVSINEETINMMTYQKAFQAAARLMSAFDETLDTLINRTGVVGR